MGLKTTEVARLPVTTSGFAAWLNQFGQRIHFLLSRYRKVRFVQEQILNTFIIQTPKHLRLNDINYLINTPAVVADPLRLGWNVKNRSKLRENPQWCVHPNF